MSQLINQFAMAAQAGMLDLRFNGDTVSAKIDATSAGSLLPSQPVKIVSSGPSLIPSVVECALNSDDVFGFINYDLKSPSFNAGDKVEISVYNGNFMYMVASAAIAQYANVGVVIGLTNPQVVTATTGLRIIGRAEDRATAAGQLIRVRIILPGALA